MNPYNFWVPLFGIIGIGIVAPGWTHFVGKLSGTPTHVQFFAGLMLPALAALLLVSWMEPGG